MANLNGVPAYFPKVWADDLEMQGLMTAIKSRMANKFDYDKKMKFWTDMVATFCQGEQNAVFTIDTLKHRFRRGDVVPSSLSAVVEQLRADGQVTTLSVWRTSHSTWLSWGVSKTTSWFYGREAEAEQFIHLPTIEKQAEQLIRLYETELMDDLEGSSDVVDYRDLQDRTKHIISTKENFDIVIDHLVDQGELTVGSSAGGEKILKFKDRRTAGPLKFTETDANVHGIRRAMRKLDQEISALEKKAQKLDADTRSCLKAGERTRATNYLRQKKQVEKSINDKDNQYQRLLTMLHQIGSTKQNKEILDAYKSGTAAFKATLARQGLSPDKIDETLDEVASSMDDYREIEDAMAQPMGSASRNAAAVSDEELEKELEELCKYKEAVSPVSPISVPLPDAPSNRLGVDEDAEEDDLQVRWKRLREAV